MKLNPELVFESNLDVRNHITDAMRTKAKETPYATFLYIGGKLIPDGSISSLRIRDTSFCPTFTTDIIKSAINGSLFNNKEIVPGAVVSVLVSDGVGLFESVFSAEKVNDDGDYITVSGSLRIPDMFRKCSCSLPGRSGEALSCMAQQMGTGFCTNIDLGDTDDAMIWVNGHNTTLDFCRYISTHAYKDDQSFFEAFISTDHNLYFVEYNRLFDKYAVKGDITNSFKINKIPSSQFDTTGSFTATATEDQIKDSPYMISNLSSLIGWNNHFDSYTLENHSANSISSGDRVIVEYYDRVAGEFISEFADVLIDHKNGMVPINRGLIVDGNKEFEGIYETYSFPMLDTDNLHKNFYWAYAFNDLNLKSVRKAGICCELTLNTYIKRGTALWVEMYQSRNNTTDQSGDNSASTEEATNDNMILDIPKTGFYIVDGIEYTITGGRMIQFVHLIRRSMTPGPESGVSITT